MSDQTPSPNPWQPLLASLFFEPAPGGELRRVPARAVSKSGRPFLLLPPDPKSALATLSLYAAQTARARAARWFLACLLRLQLPFGTNRLDIPFSSQAPFVKFLMSLAGTSRQGLPRLGILAGNPIEGQRLLIVLFNAKDHALSVVKTGISNQAQSLISQEERFLESVPRPCTGIPTVQAAFQSDRLRAVALDFFPGRSPRGEEGNSLGRLLESWVQKEPLKVAWTPRWLKLAQVAAQRRWFDTLAESLDKAKLRQVIEHGDLAPWNIRVSPDHAWTVLDWERGESAGMPGWDWFHFILQPEILVKRTSTSGLVRRVEKMLGSDTFKSYAADAGIGNLGRWLVLAYLLYMAEVIKPAEGRQPTADLLDALVARWVKESPT